MRRQALNFVLISSRVIQQGRSDSVTEIKRKIDELPNHYNRHPRPFIWTYTAESHLAKPEQQRGVINAAQHGGGNESANSRGATRTYCQ